MIFPDLSDSESDSKSGCEVGESAYFNHLTIIKNNELDGNKNNLSSKQKYMPDTNIDETANTLQSGYRILKYKLSHSSESGDKSNKKMNTIEAKNTKIGANCEDGHTELATKVQSEYHIFQMWYRYHVKVIYQRMWCKAMSGTDRMFRNMFSTN